MILDAAIIAVVGLFVWRGMRRGLIGTLAGYVGFVAAVAAAVFGYRLAAAPLASLFAFSDGVANLAGALAIFVVVMLGVMLGVRTLTRALRLTSWGTLDAAAGGVVSGVWAVSLVAVLVLAASVIPPSPAVERQIERSAIARSLVDLAPGWVDAIARTDLRPMLGLFAPDQVPVAIIATGDARPAPATATRLFDLANAERRARGLRSLAWDEQLAAVSSAHAADMYLTGFFSHVSPQNGSPRDRLRRAGVAYRIAGENLVLAPSASTAHEILMRSPRHRDHILSERYQRVGIGAMFGRQGFLIAETFAA